MMTLINGELLSSPALSLLQRWGSLSHMRSLLYFFANEAVKKKEKNAANNFNIGEFRNRIVSYPS